MNILLNEQNFFISDIMRMFVMLIAFRGLPAGGIDNTGGLFKMVFLQFKTERSIS